MRKYRSYYLCFFLFFFFGGGGGEGDVICKLKKLSNLLLIAEQSSGIHIGLTSLKIVDNKPWK